MDAKAIINEIAKLPGVSATKPTNVVLPVTKDVPEKYIIKALVLHAFVCPTGKLEERRYVRSGYEQIIDEDRLNVIRDAIAENNAVCYFPAAFWDKEKTLFEMRYRFVIASQHDEGTYDGWHEKGVDEIVHVEYELVNTVGCKHYIRGCLSKCDKCPEDKAFYVCGRCHKEQNSDVDFEMEDDKETHEDLVVSDSVKCIYCNTVQPKSLKCTSCSKEFGNYNCDVCNIIALVSENKPAHHCDKCGGCTAGPAGLFVHCDKCNKCVFEPDLAYHNEQCSGPFVADCIICAESLADTNAPFGSLPCNKEHYIHYHCYQKLLADGMMCCPICKQCIVTKNFMLKDKVKFY